MAGNLYDDALDTLGADEEQAPLAPANPFAETIQAEEDGQRTRMRGAAIQAVETTPDRAADVRRLAARTGVAPEIIERDYDTFVKRGAVEAVPYPAIQTETPRLATWLEDPQNAKIAADDIDPLRVLAKTLNVGANALRALAAGPLAQFNVGAWGTAQAAAEWLGAESLASWFKQARESASLDADVARGPQAGAGALEKAFYSGFESLGGMAPATLLGAWAGSSRAMLSVMGGQTGGAAFGQARDAGASLLQSTVFGASQSAVEVVTEFIPAKWFLDDLAQNAPFLKVLGHQLAGEVPGEQVATLLQDFNEWAVLHPDLPFQSYLEERPSAFAETLIATITAVGVQTSLGKAAASLAGDRGLATQAERDQRFLGDLASAVKASATVERSPEAAQALVADLTRGGVVEHVYAPAETFEVYWQGKALETPHGRIEGAEAIAAELTGRPNALAEAKLSGVDLEIPTSSYAVQIAGTEHHAFFTDELRIGSPERMNGRELKAFRAAELAKADEPAPDVAAPPSPVREMILRKIEAAVAGSKIKLPAGAVEGYADVFEALTATFEREGLDPVETLQRYGLLVAGPQETVASAAPKVPFAARIAEMKAARAAHVAEVEAIYAAEGGVRATLPNGVQYFVHPSTQEPGKVQVTSFTPEGEPSGHMVYDTVAEASTAFRAAELTRPAPVVPTEAGAPAAERRATERVDPADRAFYDAKNAELRAEAAREGPAYLDPEAIRAGRALAARLQVDKAAAAAQTTEDVDAQAEPLPSRLADSGRSPAGHRVPSSDPGTGKRAAARLEQHVAQLFDATVAAATAVDPAVDPAQLKAEFDFRLELFLDRQQLAAESGENPHDLLRAIAKLGGLYEPDDGKGMYGELVALGYGAKFGMLAGVPGVFAAKKRVTKAGQGTSRGFGFDVMLQKLQSDPRFAWIESISMLHDQLDELSRTSEADPTGRRLPGTEELRDVGIRQETAWWRDSWLPPAEDVDESAPAEGDLSWDVSTFDQAGQLQTETPAFRRWFGRSQVVDANGQPLRVFHSGEFDPATDAVPFTENGMHFGTRAAAQERPYGKLVDEFVQDADVAEEDGRWYWDSQGWESDEDGFASRAAAEADLRAVADTYADGMIRDIADPTVVEVYLSIQNPKRVRDQQHSWAGAIARAKAEGHDGIVYRNEYEDKGSDSWIVFTPQQIKSATGNVGTFDPEALSILFQDETPTAVYVGEQENGLGRTTSIYRIVGGPRNASTVDEATLVDLGISVPSKTAGGDVLDTGEVQPRLFEEPVAGHAAELAELPFRLTAEVAATPAAKRLQRTLFQGNIETVDPAPPPIFYSRILRTVMLSPQTRATGSQWAATIKNSKLGVSMDEFALTSVADLEPGTVYTKQEVLDYLAVNQAQIGVVMFGEPESAAIQAARAAEREAWIDEQAQKIYYREVQDRVDASEIDYDPVRLAVVETDEGWEFTLDGRDGDNYVYDTEDEAREAGEAAEEVENTRRAEAAGDDAREWAQEQTSYADAEAEAERLWDREDDDEDTTAQFAAYQINPTVGYDPASYREAFVTAEGLQYRGGTQASRARRNTLAEAEDVARHRVRALVAQVRHLEDTEASREVVDAAVEELVTARAERDRLVDEIAALGDLGPVTWEDGHEPYDNVPNPIVRVRFNTRLGRLADDPSRFVKVLFLEEVQPPSGQNQEKMPPIYLKHWREIGFKWALRYAVDHGYLAIAWTTGEQQAARYSLSRQVESVEWDDRPDNDGEVRRVVTIVVKAGGKVIVGVDRATGIVVGSPEHAAQFNQKPLSDVLGKEVASRILEAREPETITGDGLNIGGIGLARLYDVDFVNVVNKLPAVKSSGARVTGFNIGVPPPTLQVVSRTLSRPHPEIAENRFQVSQIVRTGPTPGYPQGFPQRYPHRTLFQTRGEADDFIRQQIAASQLDYESGQSDVLGLSQEDFEIEASTSVWVVVKQANEYVSGQDLGIYETQEEAQAAADAIRALPSTFQPGLLITPEIQAAVAGGQTLFQGDKDLIIQHNVTPANLRHAARLGGLPVPSLAIAKMDDPLVNFGEITLLGNKEMADPRGYAKPKVFGADVYSPRYPSITVKLDRPALAQLNATLAPYRQAGEREIYGGEIDRADDLSQRDDFRAYVTATRPDVGAHFQDQRAVAAEMLRRVGAHEQIFMGFTNAGNRRYVPHTLDRVVAILKKDLRGAESSGNIYGMGQLRSTFAPQFKSVKQIINAKDRIVSDAAFEAVKQEVEAEFFAIVDELRPYSNREAGFGFSDTVMAVMEDGATKGLRWAFQEYGDFGDVPDETLERVAAFMRNLRTMPTEYFEAKILREVDLAEFAGAVVPDDTDADILQMLEARGLQIAKYPRSGGEAGRKAATSAMAKYLGEQVLFQEEEPPTRPRGSITGPFDRNAFFGPDLQFTIKLFENADASTFLHESAHLFLKIMQDLGARPEASAGLKADLATIRTRFGPDGVDQQERFARAFETYLLEGKAPSLGLRKLFQDFRTWLLRVYRTLSSLNVQLTDDVRQVFDRMLASDAAIAEAQAAVAATPMFTTAESARMSPSEFAVYEAQVAQAGLAAREQLESQLLRDLQRQQRASYREEKQAIREQVQAEVYAMPVYQALAAMRKGTHPDGTPLVEGVALEPLRLSREIIRTRYGADRLAALPSYPPPITTAEGGMDPDTVAPLFGFASGDGLLVAVSEALPMRGLIEAETTKRMTAQAGDLLVDATLTDLARAAVANEHRAAIVEIEMRTLARLRRTAQAGAVKEREYERRWFEAEAKLRIAIAEGRKQTQIDALDAEVQTLKAQARGGMARIHASLPNPADLRDLAQARIERTRVRDLKPERFHAAARRASEDALAAAARQDIDAAIAFKRQEAMSLALYREAARATQAIEAQVRQAKALDTVASRKRLGLAGADYQAQVDAVLDRYEFARITGPALEKRQGLREWVQARQDEGLSVDLPDAVLDDARRINYSELTVAELAAVSDGLKAIVHLARLKNRLLKNKDSRDFAATRDGLVASILEHGTSTELPVAFRAKEDRHRSIREWFASHARIATLAQVMDGPGDGGAMHSAIIRPISDAVSAQEQRFVAEGRVYAEILERHYPGRALGRLHELRHIPEIGTSLTLDERLAVAKNWGNATSRDRLLSDPQRKWNQKQIQAILDTLDANDLAFVQATFDFLNRFWPEIAAKTRRLTGIEPEKVEAVPITAKAGTIAGGYYPLVADSRYNAKTKQWEKVAEAQLRTSAAYVSQTTKRGHLETRQRHATYSVKLDSGVVFAHLEQVVHDLTHHEMLIDVTRLIRDPQVADAIFKTQGDVVYDQFTGALEAIAAGKLAPAENMMDKAATFMRERTQIALLGYNLWTAVQQPLGLFNGMERVGVRWVARGMFRWLVNAATMENTIAWIHASSPLMKGRANTATTDLRDLRGALQTAGGWFDTLVRTLTADVVTQQHLLDSFLWHIGLMQRVADVPTWIGQYEKSMAAGEPEARAFAQADQAVIDSQGSGRISDLSSIQRGRPVARMFLMFYSYGSATYNATYRRAGQTNFKSPTQVASFLAGLSLIYVFPSLATVALSRMLGRSGDDDDEDWLAAYLSDAGRESVSAALNGMVLVREFGTAAADLAVVAAGGETRAGGVRGYAGPAGTRTFELLTQLFAQAKQGVPDADLFKATNAALGILFRYPAAQVQRMIDGWYALEADDTDNPAALFLGPGRK